MHLKINSHWWGQGAFWTWVPLPLMNRGAFWTWVPLHLTNRSDFWTWVPLPLTNQSTFWTWVPFPLVNRGAFWTWVPLDLTNRGAFWTWIRIYLFFPKYEYSDLDQDQITENEMIQFYACGGWIFLNWGIFYKAWLIFKWN